MPPLLVLFYCVSKETAISTLRCTWLQRCHTCSIIKVKDDQFLSVFDARLNQIFVLTFNCSAGPAPFNAKKKNGEARLFSDGWRKDTSGAYLDRKFLFPRLAARQILEMIPRLTSVSVLLPYAYVLDFDFFLV